MFQLLSPSRHYDGYWDARCRICGCTVDGVLTEDQPCRDCLRAAGGTFEPAKHAFFAWFRNGRQGDAFALLRCIMSLPGSDAPRFELLKVDESRPYEPGNVRIRPTPLKR
jgi:hypothetical protein